MYNALIPKRFGECWNPANRSNRYFKLNNRWYVKIRDHKAEGPYRSLADAKAGLKQFQKDTASKSWLSRPFRH